jgi:hypothetical protein
MAAAAAAHFAQSAAKSSDPGIKMAKALERLRSQSRQARTTGSQYSTLHASFPAPSSPPRSSGCSPETSSGWTEWNPCLPMTWEPAAFRAQSP